MISTDILIIGAGIAGIQAAKEASARGCTVLLADHNPHLGGVLPQCTHRGFAGTLSGPEYLEKQLEDFPASIDLRLQTTVLSIRRDRRAVLSSSREGVYEVSFRQLILATGCMEVAAGALDLGGTRPQGVYTAGQAQYLCNVAGELLPSPIVILGSGDLGLIMARQLTEQGGTVAAIVEKQDRCGGLVKNRRQLEPLHIPLYTGARILRLEGDPRLTGVQIQPRQGEAFSLPCKTLLIAAGLRPDRSLIRDLGTPDWLHLAGNCHHVHTMVESVTAQSGAAAAAACNAIGVDRK